MGPPITREEAEKLDTQQLIDRALDASWQLGLSAGTELWNKLYWNRQKHYDYEQEKFELRRELFRRLGE